MTLLTSVADLMTTKTICWYLFLYLMEVIKHLCASNSQLFELKSYILYYPV